MATYISILYDIILTWNLKSLVVGGGGHGGGEEGVLSGERIMNLLAKSEWICMSLNGGEVDTAINIFFLNVNLTLVETDVSHKKPPQNTFSLAL